jgi:hypothetical protein
MMTLPRKQLTSIGASLLLLSLAHNCSASSEALGNVCARESAASAGYSDSCRAYLEGFLDGAQLTDTAIADHAREDEDFFDHYAERAYRTRVNSARASVPATSLADFCVPDDLPRANIISELAAELAKTNAASENFPQTVYDLVKARLPCPT